MPKLLARATVAVVWLLAAAVAQAQNIQLWGNVTFDWVKSQRLAYGLDIEPKVLLDARRGRTRMAESGPHIQRGVLAEAVA